MPTKAELNRVLRNCKLSEDKIIYLLGRYRGRGLSIERLLSSDTPAVSPHRKEMTKKISKISELLSGFIEIRQAKA